MTLELLEENRCFSGVHRRYRHRSRELDCTMELAVYLPPQALDGPPVPSLYWLSGLTCTDRNVMEKSGIQRLAAGAGLAIVAPDTSPRGEEVPGDPDGAWDFGHGAGFYVDATASPWARHYRMHSYVVRELPDLLEAALPLNSRRGISGHSMGGHGALVCALREPQRYESVSAFAPICHPGECPWGRKAFRRFFGDDESLWRRWDACRLMAEPSGPQGGRRLPLLIDQGEADPFLEEQLRPECLQHAAHQSGYPLTLRIQKGYNHSYYFISTFLADHIAHHARFLRAEAGS